ncbi:ParB/RepB/Spo0J family partition protein [Candidatus Sumerlaeota bacterium]|nr:ParB/RepB/Spo0J family partition protein [Candidatus Sumerlaeota bacterium]
MALGRGLDTLFPEYENSISDESGSLIALPVDSIGKNPFQPRRFFDDEKLSEMASSIKERGLLQPILVRSTPNGYQLVAGERRLRASKLAGLTEIPSIIVQSDDTQTLELALIENLQRENLNPIEEARGYDELSSKFGFTQEEISLRVGKDRSTVANSLRLLKLPNTIREDLEVGRLSPGHARSLLSLENKNQQAKLWSMIVEKGLSVRQAESLAREMKDKQTTTAKNNFSSKPPDITDLEDKLMAGFGAKVHVVPSSKTSGKIIIHYSSLEDIDRIMGKIGVML